MWILYAQVCTRVPLGAAVHLTRRFTPVSSRKQNPDRMPRWTTVICYRFVKLSVKVSSRAGIQRHSEGTWEMCRYCKWGWTAAVLQRPPVTGTAARSRVGSTQPWQHETTATRLRMHFRFLLPWRHAGHRNGEVKMWKLTKAWKWQVCQRTFITANQRLYLGRKQVQYRRFVCQMTANKECAFM